MAEDKLTFLTEVELPPYCFLSEAVEWIAFGRVPQMQHELDHYSDETIDVRFYWREMPDNFQPQFEYPWFDRLEFESLDIPISEAYFDAVEKCFMESVRDIPERIAEYESKEKLLIKKDDGSTLDFYQQQITDARAKLAELGPLQSMVDQIEAQFKPHYDVACAKLFQFLVLGEITCQSLNMERWERLVEEDKYQEAAQFDDIPPTEFSLGMDWAKNEIQLGGARHGALRVSIKDILDNRSTLLQSGKPLSVERFGAFYKSSNAGRTNKRAKVGRRTVINWDALKIRLKEMSNNGTLPERKENCIYELIVFSEAELGKGPSRTAVQRNLGLELDALYAQN